MLNPEYGVGDIAKELGKKWSDADPETKSKYEAMAEKDKARYERVRINSLTFFSLFFFIIVGSQYWANIFFFFKYIRIQMKKNVITQLR